MPAPQHRQRRRRLGRFAQQLQEKQQLKQLFGIREEQLRKYYREAIRARQETGPLLVTFLERRLDNAIFRAGFAQTRPQARQMASHRLFCINGRPVSIPSQRLKKGDVVSVREGKRNASYFVNLDKRLQNVQLPSWLALSPKEFSFTAVSLPSYEESNLGVDIRAIVEYFAR